MARIARAYTGDARMSNDEILEVLEKYKYVIKNRATHFMKNYIFLSNLIDKEDFIQEINFRLIKYLRRYDSEKSSVLTYIYIHLTNACKDYIRLYLGRRDKKAKKSKYPKEICLSLDASDGITKIINNRDEMVIKIPKLLDSIGYIPYEMTPEYLDMKYITNRIEKKIEEHGDRYIDIYTLHNNGYTLKEIGEKYNLTDSRMSQCLTEIKGIIKKVKSDMEYEYGKRQTID